MHARHVQQSQVYSKCSISVYSRALKSTRQMWSSPPSHPVSALWILPPPALLPQPPPPSDRVTSGVWKAQSGSPGEEPRSWQSYGGLDRFGFCHCLRCVGLLSGSRSCLSPRGGNGWASQGTCPEVEAVLICPRLVWLEYSSRPRLCKQVIVQTRPCV